MERSAQEKIMKSIVDKGLADQDKIRNLFSSGKTGRNGDFIKILVDNNILSDRELLSIMSCEFDLPPVDLSRIKIDEDVAKLLPPKIALKYNIIALSKLGDNLTVAVTDPTDIFAIDDVRTVTRCEVSQVLASKSDIAAALNVYTSREEQDVSVILDETADGEPMVEEVERVNMESLDLSSESEAAPIVKVVSVLISEAIKRRASDIHIEPLEKSLRVRYRIDGELYDAFDLPKKNQNSIIARIKIMSSLDITENRVPQDGRFRIKLEGREIDFRVSVLPTVHGNKIVLRALDKGNITIGLESLGFLPDPLKDFDRALEKPFGIILVTGPTGSGKSTTLYSVLNKINVPEINIITVEDPVEYQVAGITQVPVNHEIGLTFASGLRSILRQTPDVILIGEIRDHETADIAIKSSLTGHLVLSTLHTNDSVGAITRLVNMGVEPFLIGSSLIMACAQRLLRKICPHCSEEATIPVDVRKDLEGRYPEVKNVDKFYQGKGCSKCNNSGYRGRLGTLETLYIEDDIRDLIGSGASEVEIRALIAEKGFRTLRQNAITKFCKGLTTLDEVYRVT